MNRTRIVFALIILGALLVVGAGFLWQTRDQKNKEAGLTRGLIGSEKEAFFQDPQVVEILRREGLEVEIQKAGSRQIATSFDLGEYDFVFPSGVPAAEKIRREQGVSKSYDVFFTPMAIASWKPIVQLLEANGIAKDQGGYYTFDVAGYLQLVTEDKRWSDLSNNAAYPVDKNVLITSTDVRKSNSAAMYLALASFVANDNNVVQNQAEIERVMSLMESLFLKQGYVEYSSAAPFEDYLVMGMGKAPLVMIYEAQFIYQAAIPNGGIAPEMMLMYPEPTLFTKHILIPLSENGERLGELLENDLELQRLAIEYGFRNDDLIYFREFTGNHQLALPNSLVNVVEPPSYEILEPMIQLIEQKY
jgi:hypothetical protein